MVSTQLLQDLDTQTTAFQEYVNDTPSPDQAVMKDLDAQAQRTVGQLNWLLKR